MAHVRGHRALSESPPASVRILALLADLGVAAGLTAAIASRLLKLELFPLEALAWSSLLAALAILGFSAVFFASPGARIWRMSRASRVPFTGISRREHLDASARLTALGASLGVALFGAVSPWLLLGDHPYFAVAETRRLEAFVPELKPSIPGDLRGDYGDWEIVPFYFSIGAWPRAYAGKPVLHSLPYEKGPPSHFVGHVVARWNMPDTRAIVHGPRTPDTGMTPAELRSCLSRATLSPGCLRLRHEVLGRHVREMLALSPRRWKLEWFEVENPAVLRHEQPIGAYLRAEGASRAQERYLLVNPRGAIQTFTLERPLSEDGERASETFARVIRSQRVSEQLNPGRAWVDRKLASVKLEEIRKIPDPKELLSRLAEVQMLLLSKISVDPKTYDSYFHLAGTAFVLANQGAKAGDTEWTAVAKPLVLSAYRYAQDISPSDPRTRELQRMWLELESRR